MLYPNKKYIDYIESVHFVWIQHVCVGKMVFALDPSNSVLKRLWFSHIFFFQKKEFDI